MKSFSVCYRYPKWFKNSRLTLLTVCDRPDMPLREDRPRGSRALAAGVLSASLSAGAVISPLQPSRPGASSGGSAAQLREIRRQLVPAIQQVLLRCRIMLFRLPAARVAGSQS